MYKLHRCGKWHNKVNFPLLAPFEYGSKAGIKWHIVETSKLRINTKMVLSTQSNKQFALG